MSPQQFLRYRPFLSGPNFCCNYRVRPYVPISSVRQCSGIPVIQVHASHYTNSANASPAKWTIQGLKFQLQPEIQDPKKGPKMAILSHFGPLMLKKSPLDKYFLIKLAEQQGLIKMQLYPLLSGCGFKDASCRNCATSQMMRKRGLPAEYRFGQISQLGHPNMSRGICGIKRYVIASQKNRTSKFFNFGQSFARYGLFRTVNI